MQRKGVIACIHHGCDRLFHHRTGCVLLSETRARNKISLTLDVTPWRYCTLAYESRASIICDLRSRTEVFWVLIAMWHQNRNLRHMVNYDGFVHLRANAVTRKKMEILPSKEFLRAFFSSLFCYYISHCQKKETQQIGRIYFVLWGFSSLIEF